MMMKMIIWYDDVDDDGDDGDDDDNHDDDMIMMMMMMMMIVKIRYVDRLIRLWRAERSLLDGGKPGVASLDVEEPRVGSLSKKDQEHESLRNHD